MSNDLLIPKIGPLPAAGDLANRAPIEKGGKGFDEILKGSVRAQPAGPVDGPTPLKFSAHALNRIKDRSISMGGDLMNRLQNAVNTAAQKGAKESLILSDDAAFIVSVKNNTVITVVDRNQLSGNVFTNIDSTVVI